MEPYMQTLILLFEAIGLVAGFIACPLLVLLLSDCRGWRKFFQGTSFESSSYMNRLSLRKLQTACAISIALGAAIWQITKIHQVQALDYQFKHFTPTWWINVLGFIVIGLSVCIHLILRRRTPCIRVGDWVVEFHRTNLTEAQVHIPRKNWWSYHSLGEAAPPDCLAVLPKQARRHPLAEGLGATLHPDTLAKLKNLGVTRLEIYSPLLNSYSFFVMQRYWGDSISGFPVVFGSSRLDLIESVGLLALRPLTRSKWLRKHNRWINDKAMLNDRISLCEWLMPACNGLSLTL